MTKKLLFKLLAGLPSLFFLGVSRLAMVENLHYGFPYPGISDSGIGVCQISASLAIVAASVALFFKHKDRLDFIIPYTVTFFAVMRLLDVTGVLIDYYNYYSAMFGTPS